MGPMKQLKRMFEPTRLIATVVMLVSIQGVTFNWYKPGNNFHPEVLLYPLTQLWLRMCVAVGFWFMFFCLFLKCQALHTCCSGKESAAPEKRLSVRQD